MSGDKPTAASYAESTRAGHPRSRTLLLVLAGILTALVAIGSAGAIALIEYIDAKLNKVPIPAIVEELRGGPVNVLLLGSDTREGLSEEEQEHKGGPEEVEGQRSDTIILVHLDPKRNKAVLVHFPRDLLVGIPGHGEDKINTALDRGGPNLVVRTIKRFTGLPIHHYVEVNFNGFRGLVDALDGVEVCLDRPLFDELAELDVPAGCQIFDGDTALAFVRARNVEGDLIPDFSRIVRQQQFIRALINKLFAPGSLLRLPSLLSAAAENVTTDTEVSTLDLTYLAGELRKFASSDPTGAKNVDLRVVPSLPQVIDEIAYVVPVQPDARRLFLALERGQPLGTLGTVLAGTPVSPAQIRVRVLDAGAGERPVASVVDLLRRAGFVVLGQGVAPEDLTATSILHRAGAEDYADTLVAFFPNLPSSEGPQEVLDGADVVVIVGPDYAGPQA